MLLDFVLGRIRVTPSNPGTRDIANQGAQVERDLEPLFAAHAAVQFDLFVESVVRSHGATLGAELGEFERVPFGGAKGTTLLTRRGERARESESFRTIFRGPKGTWQVPIAAKLVSHETETMCRSRTASQIL